MECLFSIKKQFRPLLNIWSSTLQGWDGNMKDVKDEGIKRSLGPFLYKNRN